MDLLANFSLDVLRYYVKIATLKNYTQASRELYISQPTLSRHIKALETRLGKKLFFRTKCGVELTEDGQHFYEKFVTSWLYMTILSKMLPLQRIMPVFPDL